MLDLELTMARRRQRADEIGRERRPARVWNLSPRKRAALGEDFVEWLTFATRPDTDAREPLTGLVESFELYAASEGCSWMSGRAFASALALVGLRREGTMVRGLRIHWSIPPIRLLTKLQTYGYRFAAREDQLETSAPDVTLKLERRVIDRKRTELMSTLHELDQRRAWILGGGVLRSGTYA
jgi:hypothetical protein